MKSKAMSDIQPGDLVETYTVKALIKKGVVVRQDGKLKFKVQKWDPWFHEDMGVGVFGTTLRVAGTHLIKTFGLVLVETNKPCWSDEWAIPVEAIKR